MKKNAALIAVLAVMMMTACSLFQKDSFYGQWKISLTGDHSESFNFVLTESHKISVTKSTSFQGQELEISLQGDVDETGAVNLGIYMSGQKIGDLTGKVNFETGQGKWQAYSYGGEWTATKLD